MSTDEKEQKRITRREFVKGAAVGAVGVAGAGALASCAQPTPEVIEVTKEVIKEVPVTQEVIKEVIKEVPVGAGPVTLEMYDPRGSVEVTQLFAPRLDTLEGKTICELSGGAWESDRTFPVIRELLQNKYPSVTIIPYTEFPTGSSEMVSEEAMEAIQAAGCDAVIVGNAG